MTVSRQFKSALIAIATWCAVLPALADGGVTYTQGANQHLDLQHQVGAKIYADCGNSADAELLACKRWSLGAVRNKCLNWHSSASLPETCNGSIARR
ncbi:MAG: hypothetical protein IPL73_24215 [Candidatus Obscuribacter sp.]|nr:hypothetical protein [Candidatus Obscuribacter sp.]